MKNISYKKLLSTVVFTVFQAMHLFASGGDKLPTPPRGSGGFDGGVVVGGELPIDEYIPLLFVLALVFGAIMIMKIKSKKVTV